MELYPKGISAERLKGTKTEVNLHTALSGESQAYLRYKWFEKKAKQDGFVEIAQIFCETADNEKEHAEIWFKYLGGWSSTEKNLEAAANGEHFEWETMYADFAKEIDAYIAGKYPALSSRAVVATADSMEKILVTSDGAGGYTAIPRSYIYIFLNAETTAGAPIELFKAVGGSGTFDKNFTDPAKLYPVIDSLYEQIMQKREGIYAEAGLKTCILSGELTGMLAHEAVGHTVEADLVLGGSVAAHNLGKVVASETVSLVDFAHTALGVEAPLPVYLDDEGTPAADAEIIKDGVLVGYMNSRESAQHFGMNPTGNARAYSFSDEPLIRMRNTAVLPGKDKLEDMIASVEDGYYFTSTNNGQADTTGEFMFGVCMGYEIKNGKLGRAILDTTISGVAFEMLKTVDMVSDQMHWTSSGFCGKKQPMPVGCGGSDIRCRITVGGR